MNAITSVSRRRAIKLLGTAALSATTLSYGRAAQDETEKKRTVLFFTKSSGFEHDTVKRNGEDLSLSEKILTYIGKQHGFQVIATKDGRIFDGDLTQYDAFFFFTTGDLTQTGTDQTPPMSVAGKEKLLTAIRGGKGFLGVHSASDTFHSQGDSFETQEKPDPYIAMLGGEFISHGRQQEARVRVVDAKFPGLQGSKAGFKIKEEWYSLKNFAQDIHVLTTLETKGMQDPQYARPPFPLAWVRREAKGRVYYNAMGHREDVWTSKRFQEMLAGAVAWATGGAEVEVAANMSTVTPQAWVMPPHHY